MEKERAKERDNERSLQRDLQIDFEVAHVSHLLPLVAEAGSMTKIKEGVAAYWLVEGGETNEWCVDVANTRLEPTRGAAAQVVGGRAAKELSGLAMSNAFVVAHKNVVTAKCGAVGAARFPTGQTKACCVRVAVCWTFVLCLCCFVCVPVSVSAYVRWRGQAQTQSRKQPSRPGQWDKSAKFAMQCFQRGTRVFHRLFHGRCTSSAEVTQWSREQRCKERVRVRGRCHGCCDWTSCDRAVFSASASPPVRCFRESSCASSKATFCAHPPLFLCWVPVVNAELSCALQVTMVLYTSVYE